MSSRYVRQMVEGWLQDAAFQTPFYPTLNEEQNPPDDLWCTVDFSGSYREVMTFCNGVVSEDGEFELVFMGRPGQGYDAVLQALERDVEWLMQQKDPTGKLVLTNRSAPYDYSAGDADREFAMSVYCEYVFYE